MKLVNIILSSILILGLSTLNGSAQKSKTSKSNKPDAGFVSIFDGKTTTGWRGYDKPAFPKEGWNVVDGALHCIGSGTGEAGNGGDLIYDKKLTNFELDLEWKISEGGNSGIFILAQELPGEPIWKSAPEMQILDNERHPDAKLGVDGDRMAGSLYDLIPAKPQNTKPAGQWNHVHILCYKGTVVYSQNGANVVEYHLWTEDWHKMILNSKFKDYKWIMDPAKEGYIGLQDHGDDVWFKNIKLKIL
ncbi:MAG TPA: DUF1080 domain-containing protein [Bacteroidales bacterium]|nr:DUF1080 domain-containing protein [Bacteroidales bacterium]